MGFSNIVKIRRNEMNLTQEELAEMAQCSVKTISKIENDKPVKSNILGRVANILSLELQPKGGSK